MAIKINGQDLLKRYINGQEIVRVYKNGGEIRPNTVPPTPPVFDDYLCFTATTEYVATVTLTKSGHPTAVELETSYDKNTWSDYTLGSSKPILPGQKLYWRNKSASVTGFSSDLSNYYCFNVYDGDCNISGNISSLLCKNGTNTVSRYCFCGLFQGCNKIIRADITLPATTLVRDCYVSMFHGCTSLTAAPQLPATTLADSCYNDMFRGCTSLTTIPNLPATTLAGNCYYGMFGNCTSLTTAPSLSATTLAPYCYYNMFYRCTSLTTAPSLPATTLARYCYGQMFSECTSLVIPPSLPATTLADYCYYNMFGRCTSLATLPNLPALTLPSYCYQSMFNSCNNIQLSDTPDSTYTTPYTIPSSGTGTASTQSLDNMFYGTGGTFTGTPSINTTYYTSNTIV